MKKLLSLVLFVLACLYLAAPVFAQVEVDDPEYYTKFQGQNRSINVHNWGDYISDGSDEGMDVIKEFEELTGIKVNYTTFATNEELYARLKGGGALYDVVIPSDYMIARMINEGMLEKLNYENIPNAHYTMESFLNAQYDPTNEYSLPFMWGTVGIIYNTEVVDEEDLGSWDLLWNEKYMGEILMFNNPRDAFAIALNRLGYPMNPENKEQIREAAEDLKDQKLLVQAYVMDEIFDKMIGNEAAIAPYYAGDYLLILEDNPNIGFFTPETGTNRFVDAMVIPKGAKEKECAEMFLNFMMEPEVALANMEYIAYSTPNQGTYDLLDEETKENEVLYPSQELLDKTEFFVELPTELNLYMDQMWTEILSTDEQYSKWLIPIVMILAIVASITINLLRAYRKRKEKDYLQTMDQLRKQL
ncbi:ABC transporter substrate-binding protein [Youxingia wuxianensis]|uniref:ABC transporter substrate-binding protein n=1 Tax=Youxingia wuxianensis TaxID=2763678 RepID=A0A926EM39_9FIRM|nr:ABC transporter substrate-binding protein [Youxingia wuxianensis]MBC8585116.1 ABC transporter substrate-binding protein [Youxingia wuxianensis]